MRRSRIVCAVQVHASGVATQTGTRRPLPPNPTLEIQHTVSMPSMTPEEQDAHDALLLHQRVVEDPHYVVDPLLEWG